MSLSVETYSKESYSRETINFNEITEEFIYQQILKAFDSSWISTTSFEKEASLNSGWKTFDLKTPKIELNKHLISLISDQMKRESELTIENWELRQKVN